jgi:NAD(P)-dependent dehydrogenase (short-subunit alcohol dehydrogenase family)
MNNYKSHDWLGLNSAVCVVTGAAGGIGAVVARELVKQGASVVLLDLDLSKCTELAANLSEQSEAQISALACDISDPQSVRQAAAQVQERYGRFDILINNASVLRPASLENITLEQWNQVLSVNLSGYLLCAQAFGQQMLAQGSGSIVNIASIAAHSPQPWSGAYSTAKAGVAMLSRQFAVEWGDRGIRSNAICPGLIRTPLSAAFYADPEIERQRSAMTASRRIGEPQDIADAVLFLASARSGYINGTELVVDGGFESMPMALLPRPGYEGGRP